MVAVERQSPARYVDELLKRLSYLDVAQWACRQLLLQSLNAGLKPFRIGSLLVADDRCDFHKLRRASIALNSYFVERIENGTEPFRGCAAFFHECAQRQSFARNHCFDQIDRFNLIEGRSKFLRNLVAVRHLNAIRYQAPQERGSPNVLPRAADHKTVVCPSPSHASRGALPL